MARSRRPLHATLILAWAATLTAGCQGKVVDSSSADASAGAGGATQSDGDGSAGLGGVSGGEVDGPVDGSGGASGSAGNAGDDGGAGGAGGTGGAAGAGGAAGNGGAVGAGGAAGAGGADIDEGGVADVSAGTGGSLGVDGAAGAAGSTGAGDCGVTPFNAGPSGTVLIADDFENGTASSWITAQTSTSGLPSWSVVANDGGNAVFAETGVLSSAMYVAVNGDVRWNDISIEAKVRIVSVGGSSSAYFAGVCIRFRDLDNFYCAALRTDGRLAFRARIAGSTTTLGNSITVAPVVAPGVWSTIRLEARGNTLNAYYNGSTTPDDSLTLTDCGIAAGGVALAVSNVTAEFDDVRVTVP